MRRFLAPPVLAALLVSAVVAGACSKASPQSPTGPTTGPTTSTTTASTTTGGTSAPTPSPTGEQFPLTVTDDDGVEVTLDHPPTRIVTFAPSATEVLFALGLGSDVVGVSGKFDDYPKAARSIPEVGGAGEFGVDPNIEKVVSLNPDLVLTIEGGDQWKGQLRHLGIPVFTTNSTDLDDVMHDIQTVGEVTDAVPQANALTSHMAAQARSVDTAVSSESHVSCFFEVAFNPLYTVGPGSFIYDLLQRAGCDPVTSKAKNPYPQWSVEDLVRDDPTVYLVSSESGGTVADVEHRPGFDALSAVQHDRVYLVDSDLVSRAGPRVVDGLAALAHALHPDAFGG
ncbi:MAG TPA: helical backbone metal receptor [Actinomycetota bacterium]|jgi:iron complex transport system substrate-binding protein